MMSATEILGAVVVWAGICGTAAGVTFSTDFLGALVSAAVGTGVMLSGVWMMGSAHQRPEEVGAE